MDVLHQRITGAPPPHDLAWVDELLGVTAGQLGALISRDMSMTEEGVAGALLTFWLHATGKPEQGAAKSDGPVRMSPGRRYNVVQQHIGRVPAAAKYLQITSFHGPRDPRWNVALRRAGADRIWPAIREVPGITGDMVCVAPDGGALALTLAVSIEALEAAVQALMTTELLPGEDPALLTGPDRVEVHRLLHSELPDPEKALGVVTAVPS